MTRDDIDFLALMIAATIMLVVVRALAISAEREACAKVCEEWGAWNNVAQDCAEAIRARGEI